MMVVDANLPFKKDLKVEVLDASGRVVTDGPDAYLEVVPEIDPPATCLSSDSAFKLSSGVGIFPGSVCQLGQNIMIRFSVTTNLTSTTLYTPWTPTFNVTGELVCYTCVCVCASVHVCVCVSVCTRVYL